MALIHILDEITASQIAAGEVVERPVNAVKELMENAVDAGARQIETEIAGGGLTYLRVTDDGCGMSPEDAELSIVRHATSKISCVDNIYHIASLGFRGEALASIASVSRMTITTRTADSAEGTAIRVEGGEVVSAGPAGAPQGTTVEAADLFYNVPAEIGTGRSGAHQPDGGKDGHGRSVHRLPPHQQRAHRHRDAGERPPH